MFLGVGAILQMWVTSSYIQIWLWPGLLKIWLNPGLNLTIYLGTGATEEIRLTSFSTDAIVTAQINREIKQLVNKKRLAI